MYPLNGGYGTYYNCANTCADGSGVGPYGLPTGVYACCTTNGCNTNSLGPANSIVQTCLSGSNTRVNCAAPNNKYCYVYTFFFLYFFNYMSHFCFLLVTVIGSKFRIFNINLNDFLRRITIYRIQLFIKWIVHLLKDNILCNSVKIEN